MTLAIGSTKTEQMTGDKETRELIDDVFYVWETKYGLWSTETKQGRKMLSGLYKDNVIIMTRWHLKCEQDGTLDQHTRVVGDASVGVDL